MSNYPPNKIIWECGDLVIYDADPKNPELIACYAGAVGNPKRYYFRYLSDGRQGYTDNIDHLHSPLAFPETRDWHLRQFNLRRAEVGWEPYTALDIPECKQPLPSEPPCPLTDKQIDYFADVYSMARGAVKVVARTVAADQLAGSEEAFGLTHAAIMLSRAVPAISLEQAARFIASAVAQYEGSESC